MNHQPNYAVIGDIHSQVAPLKEALEYCSLNGLTPIFLGDLFDSRVETSDSVSVYRLVSEAMNKGAYCLRSNHQNKFERYALGNNVKMAEGFERTVQDFQEAGVPVEEVSQWLQTFPYGIAFRDSRGTEYRCAHAMFPSWIVVPEQYSGVYRVDIVSRKARDYMIFGPRRKGAVWPQEETRVFWWEESSDRQWVRVAGHYHTVYTELDSMSLVLDGEMGGSTDESFNPEKARLCLWDVELKKLVEFQNHG